MSEIHKLSVVDPGAQIGTGVTISPFSVIEDDVVIGDNCWIGPHVTIMSGTRMGDNCKVFPGAVVGAIPQDLKFSGEKTTLEIGNNVIIRECCTLNRGTDAGYKTVIKDNCLLMAYVHVAHDCIIEKNVILVNNVNLAGHVEIGEYAILGGLTAVHQFVKIGDHVMVGGGSLVRKDVPPFIKVAREPLSYIGINSIGLKRRDFSEDRIANIHEIYRNIFVKNVNINIGISEVEKMGIDSDDKDYIISFLKGTERGIVKGFRTE